METLLRYDTARVFEYFKQICAIPHGSGNMGAIADFCVKFAGENGLKSIRDGADNVIIFKQGTKGYENAAPIILQGHLDMVCQKTDDSSIDFEKDGLQIYEENGYLKARGTTLGADNGIAVAMIMSILSSDNTAHPPIEAVFTTDEEIGMIGAEKLDASVLTGKRMINLDSEEADTLTVSCAGGCDFKAFLPLDKQTVHKSKVSVSLKNLNGGHSGIEINMGRVNANILMGRILNHAAQISEFDIIEINGGTKGNVIPSQCEVSLASSEPEMLSEIINEYFAVVKEEIKEREKDCAIETDIGAEADYRVFDPSAKDKLLYMLLTAPNGVVDMSREIEGLVETSLNLGVLASDSTRALMHFSIRSNKKTALEFMENKMTAFASYHGCKTEISGKYQPWEYKDNSPMQKAYIEEYLRKFNEKPNVCAIHAGLECAVFSRKIDDLDCISIGPDMTGVHTVNEQLKISSVNDIYEILCELLKKCK